MGTMNVSSASTTSFALTVYTSSTAFTLFYTDSVQDSYEEQEF